MHEGPYLRPTVTQRLRGFLGHAGEPMPAWATLDDVLDALWVALHARRDDPAFWRAFAPLVDELRADAARDPRTGLADPSAELLGRARVEDLVAELQRALGGLPSRPEPGALRRVLPRLSAPLAACLLLFGGGLACKRSSTGNGSTTDVAPPMTSLSAYVEQSTLTEDQKSGLRACVPDLAPQRHTDLMALFREATPEVIARTLEAMLQPGAECGLPAPEADAGTAAVDLAAPPPPPPPPADVAGGAPGETDADGVTLEAAPPPPPPPPPPPHWDGPPVPAPTYKGVSFS
ncbi:MAG: hypothetical protein HY905_04485 [Deltaproteobacteria bacterium]|nr:hypothetical protein [Deltaproteobacteria bacterium]